MEIPNFGFEELPLDEYDNQLMQQIEATIIANFPNESGLSIARVYTRTATAVPIFQNYDPTQERFYRIIFASNNGLV